MNSAMLQRVWTTYYNERSLIRSTKAGSREEAHIQAALTGDDSQDAVETLSSRGKKCFDLLVKYLGL